MTITIELGDTEYELEIVSYFGGSRSTRDEPGEGGHVEVGTSVKVWGFDPQPTEHGNPRATVVEVIDFKQFMKAYSEFYDHDEDVDVERIIMDTAFELATDQMEGDFDDRD